MIGNNVTQQWVITRDQHGRPEVYVELTIDTAVALSETALGMVASVTPTLRHLADHIDECHIAAGDSAPDVVDVRVEGEGHNAGDPWRVGELRTDLRNLVDLAAAWADTRSDPGSRGLLAAAQQLTKKYDL